MIISTEDRWTLVFNIYRHYELLQAGRRLRISEFEDHWRYSGLRRADLSLTLDELVSDQMLRIESTASGPAYYLTEAGAEYIKAHPETPGTRRALYQLARRPRSGGLRLERRGLAVA